MKLITWMGLVCASWMVCMGCSDDSGGSSDGLTGSDAGDTSMVSTQDSGTTEPADTRFEPDGGEGNGQPQTPPGCVNVDTPGATASCLTPTFSPEYYADEASKYFDTLDIDADRDRVPNYSPLVARWEWPPWLWLTGYTRETLISSNDALRGVDPSTVPVRDCRGFPEQPFARCYVVFEYRNGPCPIYEEFTFNDAGEMTFIEAWSNLPGFMPMDPDVDPWAEGDIPRLATRVPGLGNDEGLIDLESRWMREASMMDPEVADFARRAADPWGTFGEALEEAPDEFFALGCGW